MSTADTAASQERNQGGFVLVWMALVLTVMLGVGGFGVDVGHWYITIARLQRAADAASLAGSAYLPQNPDKAKQAAIDTLAMNGVSDPGQVVEIVQVPDKPYRLRVHLHTTVDNYFISLLDRGLGKQSFDRSAVGQFTGAMPMGSPSNVLGQEPTGLPQWNNLPGTQRDYWLVAEGGSEPKPQGDRWLTRGCSLPANQPEANENNFYGCVGGVNADYQPAGQQYVVRIPDSTIGNVVVQAFDAPYVDASDANGACTGENIAAANALRLPSDPPRLYLDGDASPYCAGDSPGTDAHQPATSTTFTLSTPKDSSGGSVPIAGCTNDFPGYSADIPTLIGTPPAGYAQTAAAFRHWYTLCTIPIGAGFVGGDYVLNVNTDANELGVNHFTLRAAVVNSDGSVNTAETTGVNLFANGKLTVGTAAVGSDTEFYLAQVPSSQAGQTFEADLFDVGDSEQAATLQVLPPADGKDGSATLSNFANCMAYGPEPNTMTGRAVPGCSVSNLTNEGYNGELLRFVIPLPGDYNCNDTDPMGCWVRIKLSYPAGTGVDDITSWEVKMSGSPVRLVQNQ